ncbi:rho GTPase-activating protein 11A [Caerostris extrusa]|uniref:Rho GTPase-activating protein 11A n=1 Tax=Caerostris extrusa TaxID=172846 RepID=A0AAV4U637_CAEEX|nr:rho GTPase-activating protein 11A [Caerostris extrusa]
MTASPGSNMALLTAIYTVVSSGWTCDFGKKIQIEHFKAGETFCHCLKNKIFGVTLAEQEWTSDSNYLLPKFIASSTTYLQKYTKEVGLFRKAGSKIRQRELRLKIENGDILEGSEPNDVACLLKQWLRELPEPLIPQHMHDLFVRCQQLDSNEKQIKACLLVCLLLPPDHLHTLKYLLCFLAKFAANSDKNMMDAHNLAITMAPNIFVMSADAVDKSKSNLVQVHVSIIQMLIENAIKIGMTSELFSLQHSPQNGKTCSELDSSGDFLDASPCKIRKKLKNGHVKIYSVVSESLLDKIQQQILRKRQKNPGIFVQQHPALFEFTCRQATSVNDQEVILLATPKDKGIKNFGTVGKKWRQKSVHGCPQPIVSIQVTSPQKDNAGSINTCNSGPFKSALSTSDNEAFVFGNDANKLCKSESIKKSTSECYLVQKFEKVRDYLCL